MNLEQLRQHPHYVYRAWDVSDRLLYVGCSLNVPNRMKDHKGWACWYKQMDRFTTEGPYSFDEARRREWEAISTEGALYNAQGQLYREWRSMVSRFFNEVIAAAVANGEPVMSAIHQANIAQTVEMPTYDEHLVALGLRDAA